MGADKILHFILAAMIALAVGGVTESSTLIGAVLGLAMLLLVRF